MKKLVVIGGGVSGLCAGIFALQRGVSCTVIDKNKSGAGALCSWKRGGYEIDGCLHWLTGTKEGTELYEIWKQTGVLTDVTVKTDAIFTSVTNDVSVSFYDDAEKTKDEMIKAYPEDEREILKFFRAVKAASSVSGTEGEKAMKKSESLLTLAPYALLSAGELAMRFKSRGMRRAVCDITGKKYSSLGLIFAYAAYSRGNGYLPEGGSGGAAKRLVERFRELGGEHLTGKRAVHADTEDGTVKVILSDGASVCGDVLLCCTDPIRAATSLFDRSYLPERTVRMIRNKAKYPLFSSVHFAFSAKKNDIHFKNTVFFPCARHSVGSVNCDRMMAREFSHEGSFAPDGMSVIQTMVFADEADCRRWIDLKKRGDGGYGEAKRKAADEVAQRICDAYPSLSGSLELIDSWTPATFSRYTCSTLGAYMGFAVTPGVIPRRFPMRLKGLDRVWFASGTARMPGGVPCAAYAAKDAVTAILDG
ncbi:MAG: NAD(P)/FAD-dependent oxidoreductase [Clostridia bacterium]|nr:NAD(P)/FAD-dependent oxidoreductase [Clostridia bacterium]